MTKTKECTSPQKKNLRGACAAQASTDRSGTLPHLQYVLGEMLYERGRPPARVIYEWSNGVAVNKYRGYDRGSYFDLYPYKCLRFAGIPMTRKQISIFDIIRL